jgi:hypothetical protein
MKNWFMWAIGVGVAIGIGIEAVKADPDSNPDSNPDMKRYPGGIRGRTDISDGFRRRCS